MDNRKGFVRAMGTCMVAFLPGLSLADAPGNMAVGEVEAIVHFCAKIDPRVGVERHLTVLTGRISPGVRSTAEYKQGYDLVSDALVKVDKAQAVPACAPLASRRDHDRGDDDHRR
jgi:hypothetical protein